jgi:hypothetical protein
VHLGLRRRALAVLVVTAVLTAIALPARADGTPSVGTAQQNLALAH